MATFSHLVDHSYAPPLSLLRLLAARLAYPVAERLEGRQVGGKIAELARHYRSSREQRYAVSVRRLVEMLRFAASEVPYYRDLFGTLGFDVEKVAADPRWLRDLPTLTKQIIAEQGPRMLSRSLAETKHHAMTTGGSTGIKATIYYDQTAADYSAAVTAFARSQIGAVHGRANLHFAASLPDTKPAAWPNRETFKNLAMNRSNIFFASVDDETLAEIWNTLQRRRPYLVHAHPSTLFALAHFVAGVVPDAPMRLRPFEVFESSGEVMDEWQRSAIAATFGCRVVDRYGLAEFGVIAYGFDPGSLDVLDSECWIEGTGDDGPVPSKIVVTGYRNRLMPLVRYETGDLALIEGKSRGERLTRIVGRVHDVIVLDGVPHLTHFIQDVLDHRVGGIKDFQIDARVAPPILRVVAQDPNSLQEIRARIESHWPGAFAIEFVELKDMVRVGDRAKFRHVVTP